jgi:hypothetical protein
MEIDLDFHRAPVRAGRVDGHARAFTRPLSAPAEIAS